MKAHNPDGYIKFGICSLVIGSTILLASLLLFAASVVPESGTYGAQKMERVSLYFTFLIAPLFYLFGFGFGFVNLFAPHGVKKRYAVCGILLNGLGLLLAAVGWILFLLLLFLIFSSASFVGPWR